MKKVWKKAINYCCMTLIIILIMSISAKAQKAAKSGTGNSVKKEFKTQKAQEGPSATNKQAQIEQMASQENEKKKIKGEETAKEKVNKGNAKPKYRKTVKRKGKVKPRD